MYLYYICKGAFFPWAKNLESVFPAHLSTQLHILTSVISSSDKFDKFWDTGVSSFEAFTLSGSEFTSEHCTSRLVIFLITVQHPDDRPLTILCKSRNWLFHLLYNLYLHSVCLQFLTVVLNFFFAKFSFNFHLLFICCGFLHFFFKFSAQFSWIICCRVEHIHSFHGLILHRDLGRIQLIHVFLFSKKVSVGIWGRKERKLL